MDFHMQFPTAHSSHRYCLIQNPLFLYYYCNPTINFQASNLNALLHVSSANTQSQKLIVIRTCMFHAHQAFTC